MWMVAFARTRFFGLLLSCLLVAGCPKGSETGAGDDSASPKSGESTSKGKAGVTLDHKIKLKGPQELELKPKDDGAKLVDASDNEIARYKDKGDKLKVKGPNDEALGYVSGDAGHLKVKGPDGETLLFELKKQDDGDYKLKDGAKNDLYKVKAKDYGLKIEDASDNEIAKVKVKGDKVDVRNASDATLFETKDGISPVAAACLAFEQIPLPLRVGLALAVQRGSAR
jgi:hypothetical protein